MFIFQGPMSLSHAQEVTSVSLRVWLNLQITAQLVTTVLLAPVIHNQQMVAQEIYAHQDSIVQQVLSL